MSADRSSPFDLAGRVALVTAASRGIGRAIAAELAGAGATVVLNARTASILEETVADLAARGHRCEAVPFDATDVAAATAAVAEIVEKHGRLDILVANAGLVHRAPIGEWTPEAWDEVVDANLRAAFFLAQAAAAPMKAGGWGRLIFTSSITGILGRATIPAYAASKAGLAGLARSLAAELGEWGITSNSIAPGYIETDLNAGLLADPVFVERVKNRTALKRWGRAAEVAGIALLLASDAGGYVTGQQIAVDGGITGTM